MNLDELNHDRAVLMLGASGMKIKTFEHLST